MEIQKLEVKQIAICELTQVRNQLNDFVKQNFDLLYEGACRTGNQIEADYYAPKRVQYNDTRLHQNIGLKCADGHKYDDDVAITEEKLKKTVTDIQFLIDGAAEVTKCSFNLIIETA